MKKMLIYISLCSIFILIQGALSVASAQSTDCGGGCTSITSSINTNIITTTNNSPMNTEDLPSTITDPDFNWNGVSDSSEADYHDNSSSNSSNAADHDGDGIPDNFDRCPTTSGRGDKYGGANSPTGCPVDSDGDDINDNDDKCPWHMGTADDFGCPEWYDDSQTSTESTNNRVLLAYLPFEGPCQIATQDTGRVNIRQHPSQDAEIATAMFPQYGYGVFGALEIDGRLWYMVDGGWVASWVTRSGGDCANISLLNDATMPDMSAHTES